MGLGEGGRKLTDAEKLARQEARKAKRAPLKAQRLEERPARQAARKTANDAERAARRAANKRPAGGGGAGSSNWNQFQAWARTNNKVPAGGLAKMDPTALNNLKAQWRPSRVKKPVGAPRPQGKAGARGDAFRAWAKANNKPKGLAKMTPEARNALLDEWRKSR